MEKKTVGVIGGGIAGLETALKLEGKSFDVDLYDPESELLFYPASHRVIEGYSPNKISIKYKNKFEDRSIRHIQEEVTGFNPDTKEIKTEEASNIYDYIVLAPGAETNYFGLDKGLTDTLKYREDLHHIREEIVENGVEEVVVVGGGATGVEAASALQEARENEGADFNIRLVEANDRILSRQSEKLSRKASKVLRKNNVEIELETVVTEINSTGVVSEDKEFPADEVVWAGGLKKHSLIEESDIPQDKIGVKVDEFQRVEGFEDVFAVGDCCSYEGSQARALYALFEAKASAKNIKRSEKNKKLKSRSIPYDPIIVYLGEGKSALEFKKLVLTGILPSMMEKIGIEKRYMWTRKYLF